MVIKNVLQTATFEASKILTKNFGKVSKYKVKEHQSSIVTQTDLQSEKKIKTIISTEFPDHNLLGEETGFENKGSEYTWVIDPIDGTSNFAAGIPWFGVLICVMKDLEPILSSCYLPVQKHCYYAEKGGGAFLNNNPIRVTSDTDLKNILMAYSLDFSHEPEKTDRETKLIGRIVQNVRNLRSTNCLVDMCLTAEGKLGACANQTTGIWDVAAPSLLIEEAGGVVTDFEGNMLDFKVTKKDYSRNFEIVASSKRLNPEIIKILNQ